MAKPFLKQVADYIFENYKDKVERLCIVLPNKRSALFLKNHLAQSFGKTIWLPHIISAEELVGSLSGLKTLEEIDLVCHLYESYKVCYGSRAENFDSFARWGQLMLQDFNEIDRCLADPVQLYENLKDVKVIENWSLGEEQLSEHQVAYLQFMSSLGAIYKHFSAFLISQRWAYQGLAYRQAVSQLPQNQFAGAYHQLLFCGFNALNAAELKIVEAFKKQQKAILLWDADTYYLDDDSQEAGFFLRNNFARFPEKEPLFIESNFKHHKNIHIVSVPKQTGQAQVVKQQLQKLLDRGVSMDTVAVVLANEKLLWPVLQQLPPGIGPVNITMEYPLRYSATYSLIDQLLQIQLAFAKQQSKTSKTVYHKDLTGLLRQPLFQSYLNAKNASINTYGLLQKVTSQNLSFLTSKTLNELFAEAYPMVGPFLQPTINTVALNDVLLKLLATLIEFFAGGAASSSHYLELEYMQVIQINLNRLSGILSRYPDFNDFHSYRQLFNLVVGNSTAPFVGEPLCGLQIMGVLETRTLDFEHIILVNVNEGVLPSGKTVNSFIPNDIKRAFGLPLYTEKDAIYAYHFYRLLQKADDITITYDSETDSFGKGEKSRFVTQLELEMRRYHPGITITTGVATYPELPPASNNTICVEKNEVILKTLLEKAVDTGEKGGLSPSGLLLYKDCALKFYFRYGVHLKETEEVEESAEANTFGSILHASLENLYKAFVGSVMDPAKLKRRMGDIDEVVHQSFISFFNNESPVGKSILQEEVIKVYVKKLISSDISLLESLQKDGKHLTLQSLEREYSAPLRIEIGGEVLTVFIKGKIDRIDVYDGKVRIIDYKSSVKDTDKFVFEKLSDLFENKNHNKQFQLLVYAWLLYKNNVCEPDMMRPCIIPFKVFNDNPKFLLSPDKKPFLLSQGFMREFEESLADYIEAIFLQGGKFVQTDDKKICEYCAYNTICNIR